MFKFIRQAIIASSSFSGSLATKCISLNDEPCLVKPNLIDLSPNELHYYLFMVSLDRCDGSCNTLDYPFDRLCVPNKAEDVNLNVFKMITRMNEAKELKKHVSYD